MAGRLVNLKTSVYLTSLIPVFIPSFLMAVIISFGSMLFVNADNFVILLVQIIAGILLYWLFLYMFSNQAYTDLVSVLQEVIFKKKRK